MDGDGEGEADLHTATVILQFLVDEPFEFGEGDDSVEFLVDLLLGHAEHRRVEVHIVPTGKLGIEPDAELEEGRDHPINLHLAFVGFIDTGEDFEECRLAGTVASDDAEKFPFFHLERDVIERFEFLIRPLPVESGRERTPNRSNLLVRDTEGLGDAGDGNGNIRIHPK